MKPCFPPRLEGGVLLLIAAVMFGYAGFFGRYHEPMLLIASASLGIAAGRNIWRWKREAATTAPEKADAE